MGYTSTTVYAYLSEPLVDIIDHDSPTTPYFISYVVYPQE